MKIIIKLPVKKDGKFKVQARGLIKGKQFLTANGVMEYIDAVLERKVLHFLGTESKEKIAIEVKEYIDSSFIEINVTEASTSLEYLIYCTSCFLEDFLSEKILKRYIDRWGKHIKGGDKK